MTRLRGVERLRATVVVGQQLYTQLCRDLNSPSDSLDDIPDREALLKAVEKLEQEAYKLGCSCASAGSSIPPMDFGSSP